MIFSPKHRVATPGKSFSLLAALIVFAISQPWLLAEKATDALSSSEIAEAKTKSLALLRDIKPVAKSTAAMKTMEMSGGIVRWGHLFGRDEITALVSVPWPKTADEEELPDGHHPGYLSFFAWEKGGWTFRQCFNADYVSLNHSAGHPIYYLQASRQTGLYDGDYLSCFYDAAAKRLVPTGFNQWGPFYIEGNYLCTTRGFERIHHDITTWLYSYSNGRQGPLLACYNENDKGNGDEYFTITIPDAKSGKVKSWAFRSEEHT